MVALSQKFLHFSCRYLALIMKSLKFSKPLLILLFLFCPFNLLGFNKMVSQPLTVAIGQGQSLYINPKIIQCCCVHNVSFLIQRCKDTYFSLIFQNYREKSTFSGCFSFLSQYGQRTETLLSLSKKVTKMFGSFKNFLYLCSVKESISECLLRSSNSDRRPVCLTIKKV